MIAPLLLAADPPHRCTGCGAKQAACQGRVRYSGRTCCTDCSHQHGTEPQEPAA